MAEKIDRILRKNYGDRLAQERSSKGFYTTITLPKGQESIKLLPISNLFYGNKQNPPRLEILLDHIKKINDLEEGAFMLGGNLFYYPAGTTDEKEKLAKNYAYDLLEILRLADKDKILFMYDGVNEAKFLDDRTLKHPIETSKIVATNLGIADRYYNATKVELNFVFNNDLTNNEPRYMPSFFSSVGPISSTTNAIANKLKTLADAHAQQNVIIDTSSSRFFTKKKMLLINEKDPLITTKREQILISPAGYTDMPQLANSKKTKSTLYPINQRYIELKIEEKIPDLQQINPREINTIKEDPYSRSANCLTIGVNYDSIIDYDLLEKLNDEMYKNLTLKEELSKILDNELDKRYEEQRKGLYEQKIEILPVGPQKPKFEGGYLFE